MLECEYQQFRDDAGQQKDLLYQNFMSAKEITSRLAPISRMPVEIQMEILLLAIWSAGNSRKHLMQVCRSWHAVIMGISRLWSSVRNVVRPDLTRSCSPASRLTTPSSYRPAGTPALCHTFLRAQLRNHHVHRSVILQPTRKPLYLNPTVDHGRSISCQFPCKQTPVEHLFPLEHSSYFRIIPFHTVSPPSFHIPPPCCPEKPCLDTDLLL
jgi:hypothetical protein